MCELQSFMTDQAISEVTESILHRSCKYYALHMIATFLVISNYLTLFIFRHLSTSLSPTRMPFRKEKRISQRREAMLLLQSFLRRNASCHRKRKLTSRLTFSALAKSFFQKRECHCSEMITGFKTGAATWTLPLHKKEPCKILDNFETLLQNLRNN